MIALAPVTLTGAPQTVNFNAGSKTGQTGQVRIANESQYALQVQLSGDIHWLDPGTVDVFTPPEKITWVKIMPTILVGAPSGSVLITLAEEGEAFAGAYPMSLPAQTSITTGTVNVGTITGPVSIGNNVPVFNASGTQMQVFVPQKSLTPPGGTPVVRDGNPHTIGPYTLDPGTRSIALTLDVFTTAAFKVVGGSTGVSYADQSVVGVNNGVFYIEVLQIQDAQISVTIFTKVGTGSMAVTVSEILDDEVITLNSNQPVSTGIRQLSGGTYQDIGVNDPPGATPRYHDGGGALLTSQLRSDPAPWQGAAQVVEMNFGNPGNGLTAVIIPGVIGQRITLLDMQWEWGSAQPTLSGRFQDTAATYNKRDGANALGSKEFDWKGLVLPLGAGFQYSQVGGPAAGTVFCVGGIGFTQQ